MLEHWIYGALHHHPYCNTLLCGRCTTLSELW